MAKRTLFRPGSRIGLRAGDGVTARESSRVLGTLEEEARLIGGRTREEEGWKALPNDLERILLAYGVGDVSAEEWARKILPDADVTTDYESKERYAQEILWGIASAREAIAKGDAVKAAIAALRVGELIERARIKFEREPAHKSETAREAVNARHNKPGGAKERREKIRAAWASGNYTSKNICAEEEYDACGYTSAEAARKALREPKKK